MKIAEGTSLQFQSALMDWSEQNSSFDKAVMRIAYHGTNRNRTSISKEVFEAAIPSMYNCPVVCRYNREDDSLGGHDVKLVKDENHDTVKIVNITHPVGVIPESANWYWQEVEEDDGTKREYLCTEVLIWKRQEAYEHLKKNGVTDESMEIRIQKGFSDEEKVFHIEKFEFTAFTLLESVAPCFPDACLEFSLDEIRQEYSLMMEDFKREFAQVTSAPAADIKLEEKGGDETLNIAEIMAEYGLEESDIDFEIEGMDEEVIRARFAEIKEKKNSPVTDSNSEEPEPEPVAEEKFSLTAEQTTQALANAVDSRKIETPYGMRAEYFMLDYDASLGEVYCRRGGDWSLIGMTYSMEGDRPVIDFDHPKPKKIVYVDLDEGEEPKVSSNEKEFIRAEVEAEFAAEKQELTELRAFKAQRLAEEHQAQADAVFAQFSDLAGNETFEALKSGCSEMSKEDIEEKCYAIRGRNASMNFSLNNNQMTVRMPVEKEVRGDEDEPYGGVFKRYGIGR